MAISFKISVNKALRATTVTAIDSRYGEIYSTTGGLGARETARLQQEAERDAKEHLRQQLLSTASTTQETRLLAARA